MIAILYFGANEASAKVLEALAHTQGFSITGVVTQPDRPSGRSQILTPSPVKKTALKLGLPVLSPDSFKNFPLEMLPKADIFVVYAYGLIIPQAILDRAPCGALNIHPSLLPKHRGPAPVQSALINGETETGVSIMLLDAQMDHGPIFKQLHAAVDPKDTAATLTEKLTALAIPALVSVISAWTQKTITPTPQDDAKATICKKLTREDGEINWRETSAKIYNLYRGFTPWPGIWTSWQGKRIKLLSVALSPLKGERASSGRVFTDKNRLYIGTADGSIEILTLQLEGKKPMSAAAFVNGYRNFIGTRLPS